MKTEKKYVVVYRSIKKGYVSQVLQDYEGWVSVKDCDLGKLRLFDTRFLGKCYISDCRRGFKTRMAVMTVEGLKRALIKRELALPSL